MNKAERDAFLRSGGTLLRAGVDNKGQHVIKQRNAQKDWHIRLNVPNAQSAQILIDTLTTNHPLKFQEN